MVAECWSDTSRRLPSSGQADKYDGSRPATDNALSTGPIAENYFRAIGIVHAVTFDGKGYRYVVEFEDSGTDTFFGFELRLASSEV